MNKLLTTALVSAILAAPSFADGGQLAAENTLAITSASANGLKGGSVGVADSGTLYVLADAQIADGQKLSLRKGVTVHMGSGTASHDGGTMTVTPSAPQAAVTLTNNGTIVIDATDLNKPINLGTIVAGSTVMQGTDCKIILNVGDTTVTYTPGTSVSYSLGSAYASEALTAYQTAIAGTGLADSYGTGAVTIYNLESSTAPGPESLKIGGTEMLGTDTGQITLNALPKIKYGTLVDDFVTALRHRADSSDTFGAYGIVFSKDATADSNSVITPTYTASASGSSAISVLTGDGAESGSLVVLPDGVTITCDSSKTIVCDLTNYKENKSYASGVKFDGAELLTLSGNVSELKNVIVGCPLKITGTTCPSGKITSNITFSKIGEGSSKVTVDYLDLSSSQTVTIDTSVEVEANYVVM